MASPMYISVRKFCGAIKAKIKGRKKTCRIQSHMLMITVTSESEHILKYPKRRTVQRQFTYNKLPNSLISRFTETPHSSELLLQNSSTKL